MAIPDYQALMLPVLQRASSGEVKIGSVVAELPDKFGLSLEERAHLLPSGRQASFANRVGWAKSYLDKAGLVESSRRGHFKITQRGLEMLKSNPETINNRSLLQFAEFRNFKDRSAKVSDPSVNIVTSINDGDKQTPDEAMRMAWAQIEAALSQDLLNRICAAPPEFFERLIVSLLLGMGYGGSRADAGRALGHSGDDGVDGVIDQDALGLDRVYVQAKRYQVSNSIGAGAIRDFFGSLDRHKAAKGLFVTTSYFSPSAKETAEFLSKRIVLIDGEQLTRLMIRHNVGCRIEETLYIKKVDEDFFE